MMGLNTCTRFRAMVARRRRRINSSLLPENMGPQTTSIQPIFPVMTSIFSRLQAEARAALRRQSFDVIAIGDQRRQRLLGQRLAVDQEDFLQARRDRRDPLEQLS